MNASFLLFNAECVNGERNSIYRLVFIPVMNNEINIPQIFMFNPQAYFEATSSGISENELKKLHTLNDLWNEIESLISNFELLVSTADGYSAIALHNTLQRLGIHMPAKQYVNAKSLCRKIYPGELSYNFDMLVDSFLPDFDDYGEIELSVSAWARLILSKLDSFEDATISDFIERVGIRKGVLSSEEFVPSVIRKLGAHSVKFDASDVEICPDEDNPFFGMNVVFTGKLESYTRDQARRLVVRIGGNTQDNVTKETNFLVVGVQDLKVVGEKGLSGKMKKAQKYLEAGQDIELIDEKDFIEMLFYR